MRVRTFSVLVLMTLSSFAAAAGITDQLPSNAEAVIVAKPLGELSAKVHQFMTQIGMAGEEPLQLDQMLGAQIDMPGLIDPARPLAFAIGSLMDAEGTLTALIPVTNLDNARQALLESGFALNENGYYANEAEGTFIKPRGDYLLAGPNLTVMETLSDAAAGLQLSRHEAKLFEQCDIIGRFRLGSVLPALTGMGRAQVMQEPELAELPFVRQTLLMALDRVDEVQTALVGVRMSEAGFNLNFSFVTDPASPLGKALDGHPSVRMEDLEGLPDQPFATVYAVGLNNAALKPAINALAEFALTDETVTSKVSPANIKKLQSILMDMMDMTSMGAVGQYLATDDAGMTSVAVAGWGRYDNLDKTMKLTAELAPLLSEVMAGAGFPMKFEYRPNVDQVHGLREDLYIVDMTDPCIPPQAQAAIAAKWGGVARMDSRMIHLDDERMVFGMGDELLESTLEAVQAGSAGVAANAEIKRTAAQLPNSATFLGFTNLGNTVRLALSNPDMPPQAMMMLGMFTTLQGTIGTAATADGGRLDLEVHLPMGLVRTATQMGMQMFGQMMGGGPGGPGGAGGPQ